MRTVRAAALAPIDPSPADLAVAAAAATIEAEAMAQASAVSEQEAARRYAGAGQAPGRGGVSERAVDMVA
jgi:hypothetical protein